MKTTASFKDKSQFDNNAWSDTGIEQSTFKDERLHKRFKSLLGHMWTGIGESIPFACQDWANTKAAYRFLSNNRVMPVLNDI